MARPRLIKRKYRWSLQQYWSIFPHWAVSEWRLWPFLVQKSLPDRSVPNVSSTSVWVLSIGLRPGDVIMCSASLPIRIWQSGFGLNLLRAWVKVVFVKGCVVLIGGTSVVAGLHMISFEVEVEVIVVCVDAELVDLLLFDFLVVTLSVWGLIRFVLNSLRPLRSKVPVCCVSLRPSLGLLHQFRS